MTTSEFLCILLNIIFNVRLFLLFFCLIHWHSGLFQNIETVPRLRPNYWLKHGRHLFLYFILCNSLVVGSPGLKGSFLLQETWWVSRNLGCFFLVATRYFPCTHCLKLFSITSTFKLVQKGGKNMEGRPFPF